MFADLIAGGEYTVGVLQDAALPSIRIEPAGEFYDYQAKYFARRHAVPLPERPRAAAEAAHARGSRSRPSTRPAAAAGGGSTSCATTRGGRYCFIEVNTTPGMTSHSLVPKAARAAGIDFDELVWRVLETSFARGRDDSALAPAAAIGQEQRKQSRTRGRWRLPRIAIDWRGLAHRVALVASIVALRRRARRLGCNRPLRVIAVDGNFQRVSPLDVEKAVAPYAERPAS